MEPSGLSRFDGNRPGGLTLILWRAGRSLVGMWRSIAQLRNWKILLTAAELSASDKVVKYVGLSSQGEFVPIAVKSHGPINRDALQFLSELGKRLVETTRDVRASLFLFQQISVVVQRFNCFVARWFYWWRPARVGCTIKRICNFCICWATRYSPGQKIIKKFVYKMV